MKQDKLLSHLKVIELASVLAGPSVGMFFAELGAEVIKIENATSGGDITRSWKLAQEDPSHPFSAYYSSVNWGKKSMLLNLNNQTDISQLLSLIKSADILICNFKPGDAEKFKLSFEELTAINSRLIYGEISGFGTGNRLAYDIVLQAETGFISMNGSSEEQQVKLPIALIDLFAAHQLKEGILLALLQQQKEMKAYKISVSLFDSALAALANQGTNWLMAGSIAKPMGMLHPNIAPYGESFACSDGKKIVLAIGSKRQFNSLCKVLKLESLAKDTKYLTNQSRIENREKLYSELKEAFKRWSRDELMEAFLENQVPAGAIRNTQEVFDLKEAKLRIQEEVKEGELLKTVRGNAFKISSN